MAGLNNGRSRIKAHGHGGSARAEYERRRARDREVRKRTFWWAVAFVVLAAAGTYVGVRALAVAANTWITTSLRHGSSTAPATVTPFNGHVANLYGLILAGATLFSTATRVWGKRQTTEAWRVGAEGEEMTAAVLDRGRAWRAGHSMEPVIRQAVREAEVVHAAAGHPVQPSPSSTGCGSPRVAASWAS